jgi:hypothetical protein
VGVVVVVVLVVVVVVSVVPFVSPSLVLFDGELKVTSYNLHENLNKPHVYSVQLDVCESCPTSEAL